jgi:hypothetical protein
MKEQGFDPNDNDAKNLAIFKFFTDTLEVKYPGIESAVVSYPMFYDFDDSNGKNDLSKMFVTKLMRNGTGQCHSLPLLYLILAEEIGAEAHLAFAPNHSYVKFQDKRGDWHNIELTTQTLTSDQFIMQTGFIKAPAIQSGIYMTPLTKKQVIAHCANDLLLYYERNFGTERFLSDGAWAILKYSDNLTSHIINHNYFQEYLDFLINQYKVLGYTQLGLEDDEVVNNIYTQMMGVRKLIDRLGYADMPEELYQRWLESVNSEAQKQEHRNRMRTLMGQIGNN